MRRSPHLATLAVLLHGLATPVAAQTTDHSATTATSEAVMQARATGTFEVKVIPITTTDSIDTGGFGRLALDKTFSGDLSGTSVGQMVASGSPEGSAGYVALERVTGILNGRSGSFVLMHNGTMTPSAMELRVTVVPGSGTGELTGLAGQFSIIIEGKKHSYVFEYSVGG